ncbi:MAG: undecaprenyl-diphosphate phosphatase [Acidobacteria bacterium]|nr:MAG: undecaprenyl-diphosphate phosphatase [Acidobacteriota bacterium]
MSVSVWQAVVLGAVQGLTEFLPVSSTAHLALVQHFLPGFRQPGILFDVMLHVGTLAAVVVHFRTRLLGTFRGLFASGAERARAAKLVLLLLLAVACTGAVTLPLKKLAVEGMTDFRRMGGALAAMSLLLFVVQRTVRSRGETGRTLEEAGWLDAVLVGGLQSVSAVFHGFSRSGNTIAVGLFRGLSPRAAAELSFLLSIPTILAAAAVENLHALRETPEAFTTDGALPAYAAGMLVAGLVGYVAVALLFRLVVSLRLTPFVVYCGALGLLLLAAPPG